MLEAVYQGDGVRAGAWNHFVVAHWTRDLAAKPLSELADVQWTLAERFGGITTLTVLGDAPSLRPPDDLRKLGAELTERFKPYARGAAMVLQAEGLRTALVRSVLTGISLAARSKMPTRIFPTVGDAVTWLAAQDDLPAPMDVPALTRAVEAFCPRDA